MATNQSAVPPSGNGPLFPENIPHELKTRDRWLLWKLEQRAGKPTKTPYQVSGALAKVNDPSTWTDFDTALAAYQRGGWSGLGVVLTDDDDLVGIDLDKCLNPDTGELDPEAARIVAELPTYCETSPSGRGLRLFGFGKLPQGGRRKGKVEMYEAGRYLTVTGHQFNGHSTLVEITPELATVHARIFGTGAAGAGGAPVASKPGPVDPPDLDDAALLDKARRAKNGADFERLWSGDASGHGGDASAADLALCNLLAFWTGNDPARIDRLFRQSGLFRPKWDKVHHSDGRTYGQATIDKAIAGNRETYSGKPGADTAQAQAQREQDGAADPLWRTDLLKDGDGKVLKVHYNAVLIAEHAFPGLIGYNEFTQRIEARTAAPWRKAPGPWTDYDTQELAFHLVAAPLCLPAFRIEMLEIGVQTAARRHPFNPAQDRLRELAECWDGAVRLDSWLTRYLNAETTADNHVYLAELGQAWLKGVAARVLFPGCKRDDVLALVGAQGYVKSSAAQAIADCIMPNAFTDSLGNLGSDEAAIGVQGIIIAEFSELAAMGRSEIEAVKAFISRPSDRYRPKYARNQSDYPRTVSFVATTNEDCGFLRDPSGNRRWWPITVAKKIDLDTLSATLPMLMGEAAARVLAGESWHITDAKALRQADAIRADCADSDVWEPAVLNAAGRLPDRDRTIGRILEDMGMDHARQDRRAQTRVSNILRANGYRRKRGRDSTGQLGYIWLLFPISKEGEQKGNTGLASEIAAVPIIPICSYQEKDYISNSGETGVERFEKGEAEKKLYREMRGTREQEGEQRGTVGHPGDASPPVDSKNSANGANSCERKPCAAAGYSPVESPAPAPAPAPRALPATASSDARTLWAVLKLYRGAETDARLAQKLGWNSARVQTAAMELRTLGFATVSGAFIGPIHPAGVGDNKEYF